MKLGINWRQEHHWSLTALQSYKSPASGSFTLGLNPKNTNKLVIWWRGSIYWTNGPWYDGSFKNLLKFPDYHANAFNYFTCISDENETTCHVSQGSGGLKMSDSGDLYAVNAYYPDDDGVFASCIPFHDGSSPECMQQEYEDCRNPDEDFIYHFGVMSTDGFKFDEEENQSCTTAGPSASMIVLVSPFLAHNLTMTFQKVQDRADGVQKRVKTYFRTPAY